MDRSRRRVVPELPLRNREILLMRTLITLFLGATCAFPAVADDVLAVKNAQELHRIDSATGQSQLIGTMPLSDPAELRIATLTRAVDGTLFAVSTAQSNPSIVLIEAARLYTVNEQTGATSLVALLPPLLPGAATVDPSDGSLYVLNVEGPLTPLGAHLRVYQVDPITGASQGKGELPLLSGPFGGLAFDDAGQLYTLQLTTQTLWRVDKNDPGGAGTVAVGPLPAGIDLLFGADLTEAPLGQLLGYEKKTGQLFRIDPASGQGAIVSSTAPDIFDAVSGSGCAGGATSFGAGCPGSGGITPTLTLSGCPEPTNAVSLDIAQGLGGSTAIVLIGSTTASVPVGFGCTLNVGSLLPVVPSVPLGGAGFGNGSTSLPFIVPPSAFGATAHVQAFVLDAGVPLGASATAGLTIQIL